MIDKTSPRLRHGIPILIVVIVALIAVLLILRLQPGTDVVEDDDEPIASTGKPDRGTATDGDFVALSNEAIRIADIGYAVAGPDRIFETIEVTGTVSADPQRVRRVQARFPGVVQEVRVAVGDRVAADAIVAIVESDESLQRYAVRAPIAGVVSERNAGPGEHSGDQSLVTITDLSKVWVEVPLFANDVAAVHVGLTAVITAEGSDQSTEGSISFISPIGSPGSQTTTARIVLPNDDGRWIPGMAVLVRLRTRDFESAVVVPRAAVQRHAGNDVVFVKTDGGFRVQPVQLGIDDGQNVQIRSGLKAGEQVASTNSYVIAAELEKGSQPRDD